MSDAILKRALNRKAKLLQELKEVEDFIRVYHQFANLPMVQDRAPDVVVSDGDTTMIAEVKQRVRLSDTIPGAAERVLRDHGEPMKLTDLIQAMSARGVQIGGKDPKVNASSIFSRARNLKNIRGRGWWISDTPFFGEDATDGPRAKESTPDPSGAGADDRKENDGGNHAAA